MQLRFSKYTGAGNDFAVAQAAEAAGVDPSRLALRLCARKTGVGVDGLVLVHPAGKGRIRVRFFNPDGSEFSTCGNGTRCAARYALDAGLVGAPPFTVETPAAEIVATMSAEGISLDYRIEAGVLREVEVEWEREGRRGWLAFVGLPHFVLPLQTLPEGPIEAACRLIRRHPEMGAEGANVNLVALDGRERGAIRTFERGVEGETLACGSGAMASVLALHAAGVCEPAVILRTRSGESLRVALGEGALEAGTPPRRGRAALASIRLAGPARRLFDGVFPFEPSGP